MASKESVLNGLMQAVVDMDEDKVVQLSGEAIDAGIAPMEAIANGLSMGMKRIGELWNEMEIFMPEVIAACDAYYAGLKILKPLIEKKSDDDYVATMVIGTIYGDVHTVGKDVAIPVYEGAGFNVIDLGVDVPPEKYIRAVKEHNALVVGLGTYMGDTFAHTKDVVAAFKEAGIRDDIIIICGGPAVEDMGAKKMGADAGVNDAWEAAERLTQIVKEFKAGRGN